MRTKPFLPIFLKSVSFNLDTIFSLAAHAFSIPAVNSLGEVQFMFNYAKIFSIVTLRFLSKLPKYNAKCQNPRLLCHNTIC